MLTSWNFDKVVDLLVQAAHISQSMIDSPETEMKSDCSPVTRADRAVENFMTEQLENTAENCYLIGEETVNSKQHGYFITYLPQIWNWHSTAVKWHVITYNSLVPSSVPTMTLSTILPLARFRATWAEI